MRILSICSQEFNTNNIIVIGDALSFEQLVGRSRRVVIDATIDGDGVNVSDSGYFDSDRQITLKIPLTNDHLNIISNLIELFPHVTISSYSGLVVGFCRSFTVSNGYIDLSINVIKRLY